MSMKTGSKKIWCVLFNCKNVHLVKSIGMIPWTMYRDYNFKGVLATYENEKYIYLDREVRGLEMEFIKKITGNFKIDSILWLFKNAKKCEVLQVYHISRVIMIYIMLFHLLNRQGKIYLKLDGCGLKGLPKGKKWEKFYLKALQYVTVMSIEFQWAIPNLQKQFGNRVIYVTNGVYSDGSVCHYDKKRNIICTCGRLGTYQKNTELLLNTFARVCKNIGNWQLQLIGSYDDKFYKYYKEWRIKNPEAAEKTCLIGEIVNRKELMQYYDLAKVFCLPSRGEACSVALMEAASRGDFLLLSDVGAAEEVVKEVGYGELFESENEVEFAEKMIKVCNALEKTKPDIHKEISDNLNAKYSWENQCKRIYEKLYEI